MRRLIGFDAVSMIGDWIAYVGISALAIDQGRDLLALVVVLVAQAAPRALCAPLAGALADRVDRRTLLVVATAARGAASLAMVGATVAGAPWWVHGAYLARMALGAFTDAATRAALPRLVPARAVERANAWANAAWSAAFITGIAAGAVVVARGGVAVAFAIDAASFAIAALGFATLPAIPVGG
ncbi:MAG: MFS transporter, partial [Deltaproteobacteria bacterium]|nr:MFS transporter [Deltaproteobacteria bacterium]